MSSNHTDRLTREDHRNEAARLARERDRSRVEDDERWLRRVQPLMGVERVRYDDTGFAPGGEL